MSLVDDHVVKIRTTAGDGSQVLRQVVICFQHHMIFLEILLFYQYVFGITI